MGVRDILKQVTKTAVDLLGGDMTLFFVATEKSQDRLFFKAIESPVDHDITDRDGNRLHDRQAEWWVTGDTFRSMSALVNGDFSRACVVRVSNGNRETWKLLQERPYDELIENGIYYRINTVLIRETKA